jgi:DNA-binding NarL/FixJ family response regulator
MIQIVIADDVTILRNGLKKILEKDGEINVCGLASDGNEAYEICAQKQPDLVLMDIMMPNADGYEGTRRIKKDFPSIKVLILTTFEDKKTISSAISSGADGYILKDVNEEKLVSAIKSTLSGINVFDTRVFDDVKQKIFSENCLPMDLTDRDKELLSLLAKGYSNMQIAESMYLSGGTVKNRITALLEKLKLKDRTQLAVYAVNHDLD